MALRRALELTVLAFALSGANAATVTAMAFDRNGHPMPDVVVYLEPLDAKPAVKIEDAVVAQEGMQFKPYITVVHPGANITFPNHDNVDHHVKSFSATKPFELKIFSSGTPPPVNFDRPGIVAIACLLHDWMRGYILVLDTPYYATGDASGTVAMSDVPAGRYTAMAWHSDLGTFLPPLQSDLTVTKDTAIRFDFPITPRKKPTPHPMH